MPQFLYRIQPTRPAMLTEGPTEREAALVSEHFAYLQDLVAQGTVFMAGRTLEAGDRAFGIVVFVAESEAAAEDLVRNDPAVKHGVMRAELFPYRVALWSPSAPPVPEPAEDVAFFRSLEERRTRALVEQQMDVIEELHAPEYELITPAGRVMSRAEYLSAIEQAPFYAAWEIGEMTCRIGSGTAAVRYQATLRFPSGREVHCWHTDLYERREGRWQAVWSQATERKNP